MKHIAVLSPEEIKKLLEGEKYLLRFFKKKPEFFDSLNIGDLVFFKVKRGEVTGQFEIGKLIFIENPESGDWNLVKSSVKETEFKELVLLNHYLLVVGISKFEQLIASPVEIEKGSKKNWVVLD